MQQSCAKIHQIHHKADIQLVNPNDHSVNACERAIQTWKNHLAAQDLIAVLRNKSLTTSMNTKPHRSLRWLAEIFSTVTEVDNEWPPRVNQLDGGALRVNASVPRVEPTSNHESTNNTWDEIHPILEKYTP
jgi:hypothetical protein